MSLKDGLAAVNLEMPPRMPRIEYSVQRHWDLVTCVTAHAFMRAGDLGKWQAYSEQCPARKHFRL